MYAISVEGYAKAVITLARNTTIARHMLCEIVRGMVVRCPFCSCHVLVLIRVRYRKFGEFILQGVS